MSLWDQYKDAHAFLEGLEGDYDDIALNWYWEQHEGIVKAIDPEHGFAWDNYTFDNAEPTPELCAALRHCRGLLETCHDQYERHGLFDCAVYVEFLRLFFRIIEVQVPREKMAQEISFVEDLFGDLTMDAKS